MSTYNWSTKVQAYLAKIAGYDVNLPEPTTKAQTYLAKLAGYETNELPAPSTKTQELLKEIAENGGGGVDLFYIFRSSDATLEAVVLPQNGERFDLTKRVSPGFRYGGYFSKYCDLTGVSESVLASVALANAAIGTRIAVEGSVKYDGSKAYYSGVKKFWDRNYAYTCSTDDTTGIKGESMLPTKGTVYFMKEVPETYSAIAQTHCYYDSTTGQVTSVFFNTLFDDLNYSLMDATGAAGAVKKTGAVVRTSLSNNLLEGTIAGAQTYNDHVVQPSNFEGIKRGWTATVDLITVKSSAGSNDVTVTAVKVTLDGVVVDGQSFTINFGDGTYGTDTGFHDVYKYR